MLKMRRHSNLPSPSQLVQRWSGGRDHYRPAGEVIKTAEYEVGPINQPDAKAFVCTHHYSRTFPARRFSYGLFRKNRLVGAAVFSHPVHNSVITKPLKVSEPTDGTELGRFVLLDEVPGNGETWFLSRCFDLLRRDGIVGVVSHSDPMQKTSVSGDIVFGGHLGVIYQAFSAVYLGTTKPRQILLLPDGRVFSERLLQKVRARIARKPAHISQGWEYGVRQLEAAGAEPLDGGELKEWFSFWLSKLTRKERHPGQHRYVWGLHRAVRKGLPATLPYPKKQQCT
jgi:hypothetical protein